MSSQFQKIIQCKQRVTKLLYVNMIEDTFLIEAYKKYESELNVELPKGYILNGFANTLISIDWNHPHHLNVYVWYKKNDSMLYDSSKWSSLLLCFDVFKYEKNHCRCHQVSVHKDSLHDTTYTQETPVPPHKIGSSILRYEIKHHLQTCVHFE